MIELITVQYGKNKKPEKPDAAHILELIKWRVSPEYDNRVDKYFPSDIAEWMLENDIIPTDIRAGEQPYTFLIDFNDEREAVQFKLVWC